MRAAARGLQPIVRRSLRVARVGLSKQLLQGSKLDRLRHVMIETRFLGAATILLLAPAGHGNQHHVSTAILLSDPASRLVAVQLRQATTFGWNAAAAPTASRPS